VVLVFDDTLAEVDAHIAAGRLPASWWTRLLAHEDGFHLAGERHTGLWHDLHAARLVARLLWARARAWVAWLAGGIARAAGRWGVLSDEGRVAAAETLIAWVRQAPNASAAIRHGRLDRAAALVAPIEADAGGLGLPLSMRLFEVEANIRELRPLYGSTARWSWLYAALGPRLFAGVGVGIGVGAGLLGAAAMAFAAGAAVAVPAALLRAGEAVRGARAASGPAWLSRALDWAGSDVGLVVLRGYVHLGVGAIVGAQLGALLVLLMALL
jgi:hypothetical protein